jgi:membrane protease YdiL (CAAX protease family)
MDSQFTASQIKPRNIITVIGIVVALLLMLVLTIVISHAGISRLERAFYSRFIYWGTVLFLLFYAWKVERQPLLTWAEKDYGIGFFLLSVVVLYLLFIAAAIVSAIPMLFGMHENNEVVKRIAQLLKDHPALLFFVAFTAGVTEELIFRGYMLTRLSQIFKKPYIPIIVSSLLFAAMHYSYKSLREVIFAFLIGIIFSVYYLKYRNIKVLIVTHFLIDFISMNLAQHFKA